MRTGFPIDMKQMQLERAFYKCLLFEKKNPTKTNNNKQNKNKKPNFDVCQD